MVHGQFLLLQQQQCNTEGTHTTNQIQYHILIYICTFIFYDYKKLGSHQCLQILPSVWTKELLIFLCRQNNLICKPVPYNYFVTFFLRGRRKRVTSGSTVWTFTSLLQISQSYLMTKLGEKMRLYNQVNMFLCNTFFSTVFVSIV